MTQIDEYTHTFGPWMIYPDGKIGSASVRRPDTIVLLPGHVKGQTIGEAMMNAKLIAAAPELLEALTKLVAAIDRMPANPADGLADDAREAIAKATR